MPRELGEQHVLDYLTLLGADVAHLPVTLLEPPLVEKLHAGGWRVHGAKIQSEAELLEALALGVDQLSTDDLELIQRVLRV